MNPNRIVALLTPLVFAPLAGAVSSWLAQHFPGVNVSESNLQAIFIGGALIALAPAAQWLHGWQKYEAREADTAHAIELGTLAGYVLGNAVVLAVTLSLSAEQVEAWGWRIPFFVALPLGLIGLYLRNRLEDTPEFRRMEAAGEAPKKAPLKEIFVHNWRMILNLIGIVLLLNIADYMLLTTMPTYFTDTLKINDNTSTMIIIGVELVQMAIIIPLGALSDRIGRKPLLLTAAIGFLVLSWPSIKLMQSGSILWLVVGFLLVALLLVLMLAVIGSTFPAMFPTRVRYGSFAIGYNISTSLFGGTCGVVVTALIKSTGNADWPAYYLMAAAVIALVPILRIPETSQVPIEQIDTEDSGGGGVLSGAASSR